MLLLAKTIVDESKWAKSLNLSNYQHLVTKIPVNRSMLVVMKATIRQGLKEHDKDLPDHMLAGSLPQCCETVTKIVFPFHKAPDESLSLIHI